MGKPGGCRTPLFKDRCFKPSKFKSHFGWMLVKDKKKACSKDDKKKKPFGADAFNCWEKTPTALAPMAETDAAAGTAKDFIKGKLPVIKGQGKSGTVIWADDARTPNCVATIQYKETVE